MAGVVIVAANIFGDIFSTVGNLLGGVASSAAAGIITVFAHAVLGSLTRAIEWLATVWMNTPTPTLVDSSGSATGTAAWMQSELLPLTAALAVGSVLVGGAKIAIAEHGGSEAREFTRWLLVYVLASAGGVAFAAMLITTCDGFANHVIAQATTGSNFGDHLAQGLGLATQAVGSATLQPQGGFLLGLAGTSTSAILAIIVGAIALVASFVEFVLMAFRGGVLVILCGLIPLAAAFSNVPTGERWLRRIAGWIVALALYKLAAAFCYAAAFQLSAGTDVIAVMDGLALLVVSVLALPVLLRLTLPAAERFTLHRGAAASTSAAMGALPTGAIALGATAGGAGAAIATGAVEQQLASPATQASQAAGGPSGASAVGGRGSGPDASRTGANGAPGAGAVGSSGPSGADGSDSAGASPSGTTSATGGGIGGGSASFAPLGTGPSSAGDPLGEAGGAEMPSGGGEAAAAPTGGDAGGSQVSSAAPGEAPPPGVTDVSPHWQRDPFDPPASSHEDGPTGTDERWSDE